MGKGVDCMSVGKLACAPEAWRGLGLDHGIDFGDRPVYPWWAKFDSRVQREKKSRLDQSREENGRADNGGFSRVELRKVKSKAE